MHEDHGVRRRMLRCLLGCWLVAGIVAARGAAEQIELLRDQWGIPHIFAASDEGAMYGLGYATAEDRSFQMYYNLRILQGRLAELIGDVKKTRRNETAVQSDRKMRTFGFYRAAKRVAARLDDESRRLLEAYCDGVNRWMAQHRSERHYLFDKLGLQPEPWTPADCIASWWHLAQFFGPDGTRDLVAARGPRPGRRGGRRAGPGPGEPAAAVVRREDVSDSWVAEVNRFLTEHGISGGDEAGGGPGPKFSHAWVVGGSKTTTASAVLVSDPQTMVGNPPLFYEFHIKGQTFDARGIGVAGSPVILIGFSHHVAWGMTALGADQADLFRLKTSPDRPNQYCVDGKWQQMELVEETIRVKGQRAQTLRVRWTRFGPDVTPYVFARPEDGQFALKRVPICELDRETIQGAVAMMRARSAEQFGEALAGWRFPSANVVFGDNEGNIGYWVLGALPLRSALSPLGGRVPHDGSRSDADWQQMVPHRLKPHVINPARGCLFSANHRPVGPFYRVYIGNTTGSMGETLRSWRLRELLIGRDRFTPEQVLQVHYSSVNPARRDIVRLGFHLRDVLQQKLSPETLRALKHLEGWRQAGFPSDLTVPGAALAGQINMLFRAGRTELAVSYGGGESGLALWLKDVARRIEQGKGAAFRPAEVALVDQSLQQAWRSAQNQYGRDPSQWLRRARAAVARRRLGYFQTLDGFPSLDPAQDLAVPALECIDGATIRSQAAQAYTQFVPMDNVDAAQSLLPIGTSERPGSPWRTSTMKLWQEGRLHPAPLSREAVERYAQSRQRLQRK